MKVCPVCEMEEEDDALSCSMCGSDFEAETEERRPQEVAPESTEEIAPDIADLGNDITETSDETSETGVTSETNETVKLAKLVKLVKTRSTS